MFDDIPIPKPAPAKPATASTARASPTNSSASSLSFTRSRTDESAYQRLDRPGARQHPRTVMSVNTSIRDSPLKPGGGTCRFPCTHPPRQQLIMFKVGPSEVSRSEVALAKAKLS